MAKKTQTTIGIEFDTLGMRGVKLETTQADLDVQRSVDAFEEVKGDFEKDDEVVRGLKELKTKLGAGAGDRVISCVSGKQTYVAQISFRRLPEEELRNALRFEVRKMLPFEVSGATIDYQALDGTAKGDKVELIVSVVANALVTRHLRSFEKAGLKLHVIDVLPATLTNAYTAVASKEVELGSAAVLLHVAPAVTTVAFEGTGVPFFTRSVYFTAEEVLSETNAHLPDHERKRRLSVFADEVYRSLAFYEKTYRVSRFSGIHVAGDYAGAQEMGSRLKESTGLSVEPFVLFETTAGVQGKSGPGKYDLALALAMRDPDV